MRAQHGLLVGLLVLGACRDHRPAPKPATPAPTASVVATVASEVPAPVPDPPVGIADFATIPDAAVTANDRAAGLLRGKKVAEARKELEAALKAAPAFETARYNLARALARDGDFAGARAALEAVFEVDFLTTRVTASADPDLAAFWTSDDGRALSAKIPRYEARYQAVLDRGVRAIVFRPAPARYDERGLEIRRPPLVRAGVFDPGTARFVAVTPRSSKSLVAYASPRVAYAALVTGSLRTLRGGVSDTGQSLDAVELYPVDTSGMSLGRIDLGAYAMGQGKLLFRKDGVRVQGHYGEDTKGPYEDWTLDFGHPPTRKGSQERPAAPPDALASVDLSADFHGYFVEETAPPGYVYAKGTLTLPGGGTVAIATPGRGPVTIVPSPGGDRVALSWQDNVSPCERGPTPGRYRLALVDVAPLTATSLGGGAGPGAAAFTASGALYVQKGYRVVRLEGSTEQELPDGVFLVPPISESSYCGGE